MKRIKGLIILFFGILLIWPANADAQVARINIQIGGPKIKAVAYKPGHLTVRRVPGIVVVNQRSINHGHVIVYKDRPNLVLSSYHDDFVKVGFTRISVKKSRRTTTVIYKKGQERVRLVVQPNHKHWEAKIVAL